VPQDFPQNFHEIFHNPLIFHWNTGFPK